MTGSTSKLLYSRPLRAAGIAALVVAGAVLVWGATTVSLDDKDQLILAVTTILLFLICNRVPGRRMTLFLTVLSGLVSLRYIAWRFTETLDFDTELQAVLGTGLALAEVYAIAVLALGYFQTIWPLERKPVPLPLDPNEWPVVDVYIPTYNESLDVVRSTVHAALQMDWPPERLRVYILDDGRRREFRDFAEACGAGYIMRPDNAHAKAGNLNHAMTLTGGEFIVVFDCDHAPTRAFLQMTIGLLVNDQRLALVQTPHHFYSPDPFQRNLAAGTRVPPEGNMFYGLVQDGNDFWDAAFFCGSCAVIRREALAAIGGFATETVTEDAHTALRLHREGWQSAFLRLPLAGGLATERLILHVGQRMRWARGMLQIFRLDNPLLGHGLSVGQRLCYLNAMMHFFFALPRIVFLTSPLAFLLFNQNMIAASPMAIVAYAAPHIFHSITTNSRIQGNWRHSFWSEIYETVLAFFLVRVTLTTLVSPRRGRFNVTEKGGLLKSSYFDMAAVYPSVLLCGVLLIGLGRGLHGLILETTTQLQFQALLMNTIWLTYSLLIALAAVAVGRETRQLRKTARIPLQLPVTVHLGDGRTVPGICHDVSLGGCGILVSAPEDVVVSADIELVFRLDEELRLPAHVVAQRGQFRHLSWRVADLADESRTVQLVFGRADAWVGWSEYPVDRPLRGLWTVLVSIRGLFRRGGKPLPRTEKLPVVPVETLPRQTEVLQPRSLSQAAAILAFALLGGLPATALGQQPDAPAPAAAAAPAQHDTRTTVVTLHDLGVGEPITMRGASPLYGVLFGVAANEVVTDARLTLSGALSEALLPRVSNVIVTLNEQYVGTIPVNPEKAEFGPIEMTVNPVFFQRNNRLNFRFTGRYTEACNDPLSGLLWATVSDRSTLNLTVTRLPPARDLARLPLPLFDPFVRQKLVLPFVLPSDAGNETLQAAAIAASWFGQLADFRGADFPVAATPPKQGNAVAVVVGETASGALLMPPPAGPTIAEIANPNDPLATLLVVAGRTGAEAVVAAQTLANGSRLLSGATATPQTSTLPERRPYDAPAWIPTDRPVRFGELVDVSALKTVGYTGTVHVPFRSAPDLHTWRGRPFGADIRFRSPPGPILDVAASRVDASINGLYLRSYSLHPADTALNWLRHNLNFSVPVPSAAIAIPVYTVFAGNDLQFFFDARPLQRGDCGAIPQDVPMSVDPDSSLDLSSAYHVTQLPNLTYFANSGFPFTRVADLSETVVVLPKQPSAGEITAFLDLMGNFGAFTSYPVNRVTVRRPAELSPLPDKDLILIGTLAQMGAAAPLVEQSPYRFDTAGLHVTLAGPLQNVWYLFGDRTGDARQKAAAALGGPLAEEAAVLIGAPSPAGSARSVVALLGGSPPALKAMVDAMRDKDLAPNLQGDLALLTGGVLTSYRSGPTHTVGEMPFWLWPDWWLRDNPLAIVVMLLAAAALLGGGLYRLLHRKAARRVASIGAGDG